jgi:hypothetical protein
MQLAVLGTLVVAWVLGPVLRVDGQEAAAARPVLTDTQIEQFLLNAKIDNIRGNRTGVTNSAVATLTDGTLTHDAQIQSVDISKFEFRGNRGTELNFRDSYRFNIAGYKLARHLGLDMVPVSVERRVQGKPAAVTWWVDDVLMDEGTRRKKKTAGPNPEKTAMQIHIMRVFDELIYNTDRNAGNLLWTKNWDMWMIDHTRAFRMTKSLLAPQFLERCERNLFAKIKALTAADLDSVLGDAVRKEEKEALLVRRDLLVKKLDELIAAKGEDRVLYVIDP